MMRTYWILCGVLSFVGGCCSGTCVTDDLDDARARLELIEKQKVQAEEIAKAVAIAENTSAGNSQDDTQVSSDEPELPADVIEPIPDPISERPAPTVKFEDMASVPAVAAKERLPRGLLIVGQYCAPCDRMKRELQGFAGKADTPIFDNLLGDASAPIQLVENWKANDLEKLGITPGMLQGTPTLVVLGADGKVHGLGPGGLGCKLQGYHPRIGVMVYLSQSDHAVDMTPAKEPEPVQPDVVATVENAEPTAETFAAVLSEHLIRSSGQEQDGPFLTGSLFDFSITVDQSWKNIALKILSSEKIEFPAAGLTVDWSGPERTFAIGKGEITISPPIKATVKKWVFSYSAGLNGVAFADDLSTVSVDLSGCPDVTIRLVSMAKYMAPWLSRELKEPAAVIDRTLVP